MRLTMRHLRFYALYFMMFLAEAIGYSLLVPFLTGLGYSGTQRSLLFVFDAVCGMGLQTLVGYLCDKNQKIKPYWYIILIIFSISVFVVYRTTEMNFLLHLFIVAVVGGMLRMTNGLADSLTLETSEECRNSFGIIRAFGSVGWALGAPLVAEIVEKGGYGAIGWFFMVSTAILILVTLGIKDVKKPGEKNSVTVNDLKQLISRKDYMMVVVILLLFFIVDTTQSYSMPAKILYLNGTEKDVGTFWALTAMVELPLFLYGGRLCMKYGAMKLLAMSGIVYVIRWMMIGLVTSLPMFLIVSSLQMFTYPILIVTSKILVDERTPDILKTSGQQFAMSVYFSGSAIISPILSGVLEDHVGVNMALMIIGVLALVPTVTALKAVRDR